MVMMTGLEQSSILASMPRSAGGLPCPAAACSNSLISAPAMKVRPPPITTTARTAASRSAASMARSMPSGTTGLNAFTGGLLMVTTITSSCRWCRTSSLMGLRVELSSGILAHWREAISGQRSALSNQLPARHRSLAVAAARLALHFGVRKNELVPGRLEGDAQHLCKTRHGYIPHPQWHFYSRDQRL